MENIEFIPTNYPSDWTDAEWELIEEYFYEEPLLFYHIQKN